MDNIRIIKTGINVSRFLKQLHKHPNDWGAQKNIEGIKNVHDEHGFPAIDAGVLQLVIGGVTSPDQYVGDTELCQPTKAFYNHTEIVGFMTRHFHTFRRCGFLSLPVGGSVGIHIDKGSIARILNTTVEESGGIGIDVTGASYAYIGVFIPRVPTLGPNTVRNNASVTKSFQARALSAVSTRSPRNADKV